MINFQSPPWMKKAFCRYANGDIFFEEGNESTAKAFCEKCSVRDICLTWAMDNNEFGVWGGTTESERRAAKRGGKRLSCPGCDAKTIYSDGSSQICVSCTISWLI